MENTEPDPAPTKQGKRQLTTEEKRERAKARLIEAIHSGEADSVVEKVGLILRTSKKARNSDIVLMWEYWKAYEPEKIVGDKVTYDAMFKLSRLISIVRARAKIQNEYHLYEAEDEVKRRRGSLSEEIKNAMLEDRPDFPIYSVYVDESGKTEGNYLLLGSLWFYEANSELKKQLELRNWKKDSNVVHDFHFTKSKPEQVQNYKQFISKFLEDNHAFGFKLIIVKRSGLPNVNVALNYMLLELIKQGVFDEDQSNNAPLPRRLEVCVDSDNIHADNLRLSAIRSIIEGIEFGKELHIENFTALDDKKNLFLQITDLFVASINRRLNNTSANRNHKDELSDFVIDKLSLSFDGEMTIQGNQIVKIFSMGPIPEEDIVLNQEPHNER